MYEQFIATLNADNVLSPETMFTILEEMNPLSRQDLKNKVQAIARKFGLSRQFEPTYKAASREIARRNRGTVGGQKTAFTGQPLQLNCGEWKCDDTGVSSPVINRNGDDYEIKFACTIPIMPVELLTNTDTHTERVRLAYSIGGEWRYMTVDRLTVASAHKIVELSNSGVEVTSENAKLLVRYIADLIALNADILPRRLAVSRLGWENDGFIPYTDEVRFDGDQNNKALRDNVRSVGSEEAWIEFMRPLMLESTLFRLTMAASLASPLISRVHALPFVWHLWGGTGSGKTVATMCAMSVWGDPRVGSLTRTMNMTQNSMMATAAFLHDIPFAGDELQIIKDKNITYDRLIMAVTEGVDRGRMKYDKNEALKTWSCSFLFTGEDPVTNYSSGGGVINRVIESEAYEVLVKDGNGTVEFIKSNHGLIGEKYVKILVQNAEEVRKMYNRAFSGLLAVAPNITEKKAQTGALLLVADAIASVDIFGIKPLDVSAILPLLKDANEVSVSERAHTFIMDALARNNGRFVDHGVNPQGEIWGRIDIDKILINKTVLCELLHNEGFEFESVKRDWAKKGYIVLNSQGRYVHHTRVCGTKALYIGLSLANEDESQC